MLFNVGAFAFVYKVMSINKDDNKEMYALKKIICQTEEQMDQARKEVQMMTCIKHPNILSLVDCCEQLSSKTTGGHTEMLLLMPLMAYSLQSIIDNGCGYPSCSLSDGLDVLNILRQCVEGVTAIHSHGVRHGDLKPANILLSTSYHAVITDFGSASEIPFTVTSRSVALEVQERASEFSTASYRAPELFNTPSSCTIAGEPDVWAIGCIMYCLFYSQTPFESPSEGLSTLAVMSAHYSIPESNVWSQDYLDVIDSCLRADPADRTTIEDLLVTLKCILCPPLDLRATAPPSTAIDSSIQAAEVVVDVEASADNDDVFSTSGMSTTVDTLTSCGDYVNVIGEADSSSSSNSSSNYLFADFSDTNNNYVDVVHNSATADGSSSSSSSCESSRQLKPIITEEDVSMMGVSSSSFVSIGNSMKLSDFTISPDHSPVMRKPLHNNNINSSHSTDSSQDEFGDFCIPFGDDLPTDNNNNNNNSNTAYTDIKKTAVVAEEEEEEKEVGATMEEKDDEVVKGVGMQSADAESADVEVIDLWSIIISEYRDQSLVVKESTVYMMRFTGFPKKLVKKQVHAYHITDLTLSI